MANKTTFQLDITQAGLQILQDMALPTVKQSAQAIAQRATSMTGQVYDISSRVGVIKRGQRAIATVTANQNDDPHKAYVARTALLKAKDAGRVS